jgi:hypothetical protein
MVGYVERAVQQFTQLLASRRRGDTVAGVYRLDRCHVVRLRANAADALRNLRQIFYIPALGESLESPGLRYLKVSIGYITILV